MQPWAIDLILWCMGIYIMLITIDAIIKKKWMSFVFNLILLSAAFFILTITTDFPKKHTAFGGVSPILAILIMFLSTCFGMAAWYIRSARKLNWLNFFKTLTISPIVLVPMIGTVQGATTIEPVQMISLGLLAFQNGYFWKTILDNTKRQLDSSNNQNKNSRI